VRLMLSQVDNDFPGRGTMIRSASW
jgi:hypothetical protein